MYVRKESIVNSQNFLIINEVGKYLGEITREHFIECWDNSVDILIEDGYEYYTVDKDLLFHFILFNGEK